MSDYQFQVNRPINQVKEYFKSRKLYVQFAVLIALLSGICIALFLYYRRENFDLLTNTGFVAETFSDKWNDGNSEVKQTSSTMDEIQYWYRLQNKFAYPYAGLLFRKRDYALFSLENYKLILDIAVTQNQRLPVRIVNFEEGLSKRNDYNTFRLYQQNYSLEKGENHLEIYFNEIVQTPEWWFTINKLRKVDVKGQSKKHVGHVSLFSDPGIQINEKREFTITKMRLTGDYNFLWSMFIRLWIAGIVLFGLFHLVRYQMQKLRVKFNVSAEEFSFSSIEQGTDFKNLILKFMEENYFNSELKSADLANFLKVPEYKISGILKQTIGISFKSLLNQTRIEAARNSLKTSSLSISEIAYKTGFNSPSSFNRVFKEITSKAPGDFRLDY